MLDRYIAKTFAISDDPLLDRLSLLKLLAFRKKKLSLLSRQFPLLLSFIDLFPYKSFCYSNTLLPQYLIEFDAALFSPSIYITPSNTLDELTPPQAQPIFLSHFEKFLNNGISFFTDASKTGPGCYVGFAVYSSNLNLIIQRKISSHASIFTALAIHSVLEIIISRNIPNSTIFSDSLSVIKSLPSDKLFLPNNYVVARIRTLLFRASALGLDVTIVWIPAHVGILGNETADQLAKLAIRFGDPLPSCLPVTDILTIPNAKCKSRSKQSLILRLLERVLITIIMPYTTHLRHGLMEYQLKDFLLPLFAV